MALGSFLKSLFVGKTGTGQTEPSEPIDYKEFAIEAAPINEDGKYRTAGYISGEVDGESRRIQFIRADQNADLQLAIDHSISKARQIIDEQGTSLLDKTHL
jgi:hypothetical protein